MRLGRIFIENFRNFRKIEISSFPTSAIIVGENGVGKSNFLHALRLVLDPDLPDSARRLRAEDISEYADAGLTSGVEVRVQVDLADIDGDPASEALCDGCYVNLDPLIARLTYVFRPRTTHADSIKELTRSDYEWGIFGGPNEDQDARRFRRDLSLMVLPALRDAVSELSRWRGSPLQELLEARPPAAAALKSAAATVTEAMDELAKDKQIKAVASDLSTRINDMAGPRLDVTPTLGFASSIPERLLRSIRLFVDSERSRSVGDTSTGNANVIYLSMLLERLESRRVTDVVIDTVLAVEEPEAHIHPVLQRQLFRYLIDSETALVVTTHSPHIAAVTKLDSLLLLRQDSRGATIVETTSRLSMIESEKSDLERYLDVTRAELLFCNAAVLVEGPSEVYLVPAIARALAFDLDAYGVIVANIAGTDFKPYRKLLGKDGLRIPHAIITDGDPMNRTQQFRLLGLKRAGRLLEDKSARQNYSDRHAEMLIEGRETDTTALQRIASDDGVHVGIVTLEADLAPLLADEMVASLEELESSAPLNVKFQAAIREAQQQNPSADQKEEILRRINSISKGRFAQRLAAHIETAADEVLQRVADAATSKDDERYENPSDEVVDESKPRPYDWLTIARYGYILAALDQMSRVVRNHGLLEEPAAVSNGQDLLPSNDNE